MREELGLRARARRRRVSVHDYGVMGRSFDEIARASGSGAASVTSASSSGSHERSSGFMPNAGLNAARHAGWGDEGSVVPCARARALSPSRVAPHGSLLRNFDVIIWFIRIGLPPSALVATFCRFRFGALIGYERAKRGRAGAEARVCESSRSIRDTTARANLECLAHARADREHARHQRRADHFNVARAQLKRRATQERERERARASDGAGLRRARRTHRLRILIFQLLLGGLRRGRRAARAPAEFDGAAAQLGRASDAELGCAADRRAAGDRKLRFQKVPLSRALAPHRGVTSSNRACSAWSCGDRVTMPQV